MLATKDKGINNAEKGGTLQEAPDTLTPSAASPQGRK